MMKMTNEEFFVFVIVLEIVFIPTRYVNFIFESIFDNLW